MTLGLLCSAVRSSSCGAALFAFLFGGTAAGGAGGVLTCGIGGMARISEETTGAVRTRLVWAIRGDLLVCSLMRR